MQRCSARAASCCACRPAATPHHAVTAVKAVRRRWKLKKRRVKKKRRSRHRRAAQRGHRCGHRHSLFHQRHKVQRVARRKKSELGHKGFGRKKWGKVADAAMPIGTELRSVQRMSFAVVGRRCVLCSSARDDHFRGRKGDVVVKSFHHQLRCEREQKQPRQPHTMPDAQGK